VLNARLKKENTATRIGSLFRDILLYFNNLIQNAILGIIIKGEKANEEEIKAITDPAKGDTYKAIDTKHYWTYDGIQWNDVGEIIPSNVLTNNNITTTLGITDDHIPSESAVQKALPDYIISKNLFDKSTALVGWLQPNAVTDIAQAEGWTVAIVRGLKPNTDYTLSAEIKGRTGLGLYTDETTCTQWLGIITGTFNTGNNTIVKFNLASPDHPDWKNVQLEEGSQATQYESFKLISKDNIEGYNEIIEETSELTATLETALITVEESKKVTDVFNITENKGSNLIDPSLVKDGFYVSPTTGLLIPFEQYGAIEDVPVLPNTLYTGLNVNVYNRVFRHVAFKNKSGQIISGISTTTSSFTTPDNCELVSMSLYGPVYDPLISYDKYGLFKGASPVFEPYYNIKSVSIDNDAETEDKLDHDVASIKDIKNYLAGYIPEDQPLSFTISGSQITFKVDNGTITGLINENRGYDGNNMFNFSNISLSGLSLNIGDDVAPMHIFNGTLGANHGTGCTIATITAHGKTNNDIKSEWTHSNGTKFYIMRIVSATQILFMSENKGTATSPNYSGMTTGTLTNGSETLTVSAVTDKQLYPSIKNLSLKALKNGLYKLSADGNYKADFVDIIESYEIMNPVSVFNNLTATGNDPVYDGDSAIKVENIYRFLPGGVVLVMSNVEALQDTTMRDIMFTQAVRLNIASKYYVPNSLPVNGYDFRKPLQVAWSSSISSMNFTSSAWNDASNPVNRVLQYYNDLGMAIGFLETAGIGENLQDYTRNTFELRNNSGKVYPHGVDSGRLGSTLTAGTKFSCVMYRAYMDLPSVSLFGRMSLYHFPYQGKEYVFIDYSASMTDHVILDDSFEGSAIEVVNAVNTTLVNNKYNGGFTVQANYVEGETCFICIRL